jgi:hypothetical protein
MILYDKSIEQHINHQVDIHKEPVAQINHEQLITLNQDIRRMQ